MAKKIKISESQYNTLQKYLVETPYDEVYKSIKVDDIIEIENKGNISKYKVMYLVVIKMLFYLGNTKC
jgi:hypothetical protein